MKRKFIHNLDKCVGCNACVTSCKNEYQTPATINYRQVFPANEDPNNPERNFISFACSHCENPACMTNCPTSAYTKRADGVVIHEIASCIGCKLCTVACPYGSPTYSPVTGKVYKCQMCYQKVDNKELPSCVSGCPVGALGMMDIDSGLVQTSLGEGKAAQAVDSLPELPSNSITNPQHRFIKRKPTKQVRYDANPVG